MLCNYIGTEVQIIDKRFLSFDSYYYFFICMKDFKAGLNQYLTTFQYKNAFTGKIV